jgi:tetratricopeptide (TPR) repeat protein
MMDLGVIFPFFIFSQAGWSFAQSPNSASGLEAMMNATIESTYSYDFKEALETTKKMIMAYPTKPEGYLYRCGVYQKMIEEDCIGSVDTTTLGISKLIDKACELSAAEVKENPDDVLGLFCYAGALVYRARTEAAHRDWLAVMSDGIKTKKLLEKAIEIDSNFYDAYSGIGAFGYYAARMPWYLKPIAFVLGVSGNEDEGILQLRKAAQLGRYSKIEASVFLASVVYANKEEYSSAENIMLELHRQFPGNFDFIRNLCHDYYKMQNYGAVISYADTALSMGDTSASCHSRSLGYIRFYRGKSYERLNENDKAMADYEMVVRLNGADYSGKEAKAALEELRNR